MEQLLAKFQVVWDTESTENFHDGMLSTDNVLTEGERRKDA